MRARLQCRRLRLQPDEFVVHKLNAGQLGGNAHIVVRIGGREFWQTNLVQQRMCLAAHHLALWTCDHGHAHPQRLATGQATGKRKRVQWNVNVGVLLEQVGRHIAHTQWAPTQRLQGPAALGANGPRRGSLPPDLGLGQARCIGHVGVVFKAGKCGASNGGMVWHPAPRVAPIAIQGMARRRS